MLPPPRIYGQEVTFVANDYHTALVPALMAERFRPGGTYAAAKCALAIHNLAHQVGGWMSVCVCGGEGLWSRHALLPATPHVRPCQVSRLQTGHARCNPR